MSRGKAGGEDPSSELPVVAAKQAIVDLVRKHSATVIIGETGSGKSTMVPQFLYDEIVKKQISSVNPAMCLVGVTQPRRVAAVTLARYVAKQRGGQLGGEVGYAVRFDDTSSAATRIKFMTDGILLREIQADPSLSKYAVLVLDEAHERTLHGDVLFGLVKNIVKERRSKDLKVVVMSATLNSKQFSSFWFNAPIGVVHGRVFPVTIMHTVEPQTDFVEATISSVLRLHVEEGPGDILCFLTGQDEIEDALRALKERMKRLPQSVPSFHVVPLYAALPYERQLSVFEPAPAGQRKVILATNIAETSITVEGIKFVVDSGCVKAKSFNPQTGLESLKVVPVSKAQALQRTGRAGRMAAGKCFRLFTEQSFEGLADATIPEIRRCSLNSIVLQMKALGIRDVLQFDFMDPPPADAVRHALEVLYLIGALNSQLLITPLGKRLTDFPLEPTAAKALLAGQALEVGEDLVIVMAMLSTENIFLTSMEHRDKAEESRQKFAVGSGDHVTYLHLFRQYLQQPRARRREWCDSYSFSHRQLSFVEDTCKQLRLLLSSEAPTREWFQVTQNSTVGKNSIDQSAKRHRDGQPVSSLSEDKGELDVASVHRRGGDVFDDNEKIRRAICFGYCLNAAYFDPKLKEYRSVVSRRIVYLHPTSVLFSSRRKPPLVVFNNVVQTTKSFMKDVSVVQEQWLLDAAPHAFALRSSA
jgi:ATP-dependent RNA helicase DHX8/PRP22